MNYCLLFMVSVFCLLVVPNTSDYYYIPRYIALAIVSLTAGFLYIKNVGFTSIKKCYGLLVFFLLLIISTVLGIDPLNSWIGSTRCTGLSTYVFCAILFFSAAASNQQNKIIKYAVYTGMIVSILAILQWFGLYLVPYEKFRNELIVYATFPNRNFGGAYLVFLLPAPILLWLHERKPIWLAAAAILFAGLMISLTRGAWLTFFIICIYLLIETFQGKYNKKAMAALFITMAVVFLLLVSTRDGILIGRTASIAGEINAGVKAEDGAGASRIFIWKECLKLIPQYWAFGMGLDNMENAHIKLYNSLIADKAHNIYIDMLVGIGVFPFIAFLYFLFTVIKIPENGDQEILFLMILSYLIQGLFTFEVIMIMPLFWIVLGFSYRQRQGKVY